MIITLSLANVPIELDCCFTEYLPKYEKFIIAESPIEHVKMNMRDIEKSSVSYEEGSSLSYVEHMELVLHISNGLLKHGCVVFHGVAFVWKGKAWMITAPPGTGKTTHYIRWKMLYGDEIYMLNGDKPVLECTDYGIFVHPSPWNGKENMGQMISAPLGGIVILEQADKNSIERVGKEAIFPIFKQFFYKANRESVKSIFEIEDKMLKSVPVFKLRNVGDEESAKMCRKALEEVME